MIERVGIMGGMFDPVHIGHTEVARAALNRLQLDQVRLVPCSIPNHRPDAFCSSSQRLDMLELAVSRCSGLVVDARELERPGTSYSYDTLQSMQSDFPDASLYFILGADAFESLPGWHRWKELLNLCHLVVIERDQQSMAMTGLKDELVELVQSRRARNPDQLAAKKNGMIYFMEGLDYPLSSTLVRAQVRRHESLDKLLDPAVADYLTKHELYQQPYFKTEDQ